MQTKYPVGYNPVKVKPVRPGTGGGYVVPNPTDGTGDTKPGTGISVGPPATSPNDPPPSPPPDANPYPTMNPGVFSNAEARITHGEGKYHLVVKRAGVVVLDKRYSGEEMTVNFLDDFVGTLRFAPPIDREP